MTHGDLISELRSANSPHAEAIATGLTNGSMRLDPPRGDVSVKELLSTYRVRREHLSKFSGQHAKELHRDVAKLSEELETTTASRCELLNIRGSNPGESYAVFRDRDAGLILGCCHLFSKTESSGAEWDKLWNG